MSNLVIITQYTENYGAFDWDGVGICPQNWKMKGGATYIIPDASSQFTKDDMEKALSCIESSNQVAKELIVDVNVTESTPKEYEGSAPWIVRRNGYGVLIASRDNESYIMKPNGEREDYRSYGAISCS